MSDIRVRFAPSPTGYLHIGGARTALYNYLYAKRNGGAFILRIEDTDRERSTDESVQAILDGMHWLGLDWDEGPDKPGEHGPYFQTERMALYKEHIQRLVDKGMAYRCYATKEELDEMRQKAKEAKGSLHYDRRWRDKTQADWPDDRDYVLRFKAPIEGEVVVQDKIKGRVAFPVADHIDDFVIARSDGSPTYNFTVVVDDMTMGITDVIRGDDHLNNTPKQILLYEAFGYPLPKFAHLPMILGADKTRLSKRHGATSVMAYRDMGYLPHALVNYLARLGWAFGDNEIFSLAEAIEHFSLEKVGQSASVFNPEKLLWTNHQYIQNDPAESIAEKLLFHLEKMGIETKADERLLGIIEELRPRSETLAAMAEKAAIFYLELFEYDEKAEKKVMKAAALKPLAYLTEKLEALDSFTREEIKLAFDDTMQTFEIKMGKIAQPVRVALTGTSVSPGIYETVELMGRERTLERLKRGVKHLERKFPAEA